MFGRDTAPDFQGVVDIISISLNALPLKHMTKYVTLNLD